MSSVLDDLSTMLSGPNPDLTSASGRHDAAKKLEEVQSAIYDCFDNTMAASKGFTATYHSMLETHKVCAQLLELCLALSQPNSVSVQRILAQKAQIELDMIEMVSTQSRTMQIIQLLHDCNQLVIRKLQYLKQLEEENKKCCKRKADQMDGGSGSESSEAE